MMHPANPKQGVFQPLKAPEPHNLVVKATVAPGWESSWLEKVPLIGRYLYVWLFAVWTYTTKYEKVADFLAEDLERGSEEWVGMKVGYKEKGKVKDA
jgi:hypothetical protein